MLKFPKEETVMQHFPSLPNPSTLSSRDIYTRKHGAGDKVQTQLAVGLPSFFAGRPFYSHHAFTS